ncbi:hypothetical protein IAU60_003384 [Kwoniella sp. DSM 27419]
MMIPQSVHTPRPVSSPSLIVLDDPLLSRPSLLDSERIEELIGTEWPVTEYRDSGYQSGINPWAAPFLPAQRLKRQASCGQLLPRILHGNDHDLTSKLYTLVGPPRYATKPKHHYSQELLLTIPTTPLVDYGEEPHTPPSRDCSTPEITPGLESSQSGHGDLALGEYSILITDIDELQTLFKYDFVSVPYPTDATPDPSPNSLPKELEQRLEWEEAAEADESARNFLLDGLDGTEHLCRQLDSNLLDDSPLISESHQWHTFLNAELHPSSPFPSRAQSPILRPHTPDTESVMLVDTRVGGRTPRSSTHSKGGRKVLEIPMITIPPATSTSAVHNISPYRLLFETPSPRLNVPSHLLQLQPADQLQTDAMKSWMATEPTADSKRYKRRLLKNLTNIVNARFGSTLPDGQPRFEVDIFGSVSWGGETGKSGDLDLVILDKALPQGYIPSLWRTPPETTPAKSTSRSRVPQRIGELPDLYHTYTLANCLRAAYQREVQPIPAASTPIVKFVDSGSEALDCDINVNDLGGWYNSSLILHYCLTSPHLLRPLIHVLKLWASCHRLNDASGASGPATMSSYCLTLMAIAYLQHRGCLPNLQADVRVPDVNIPSDTQDSDVVWTSWSKDQGVPARVAFARAPPVDWKSAEPDLTVADALRGFFAFFMEVPKAKQAGRFQHDSQIVSILQGGIVDRAGKAGSDKADIDKLRAKLISEGYAPDQILTILMMYREQQGAEEAKMGKGDRGIQPRSWNEKRLVVQDPFLWTKNCAGAMSKQGLDRWLACASRSHQLLTLKGREATLAELLYNPDPEHVSTPRRGRGRGRGSIPVPRSPPVPVGNPGHSPIPHITPSPTPIRGGGRGRGMRGSPAPGGTPVRGRGGAPRGSWRGAS